MADQNIDDFFKQGLKGHAEEPSDKVWAGIEDAINPTPTPNYSRLLLLLLLLIFAGASGYLMYELNSVNKKVAELSKEIKVKKEKEANEKRPNSESFIEDQDRSQTPNKAQTDSRIQANEKPKNESGTLINSSKSSQKAAANKPEINTKAPTASIRSALEINQFIGQEQSGKPSESIMPIGSKNQAIASSEFNTQEGIKSALNQKDIHFTPIPSLGSEFEYSLNPSFDNSGAKDYYAPKLGKWLLGAYHIASFNYRRLSSESPIGDDLIDVLNEAEMSAINQGAGLSLSYEPNEKWRFGVGIEALKRTQESTYRVGFEATDITSIPNPTTGAGWSLGESVNSSFGEIEIDVSNLNDLPEQINFAGLETASFETDLVSNRSMQIIRVPLNAEYLLKSGRWTFTLGGGLAYNRVSSDETVYSLEGLDQPEIVQRNSVRGNYLALHGGIAIELGLAERLRIRINPTYESWLSPIYSDENLRTLPYSFSVRTGLVYDLR